MQRFREAGRGHALLLLGLSEGQKISFGLHLNPQQVALERDARSNGLFDLGRIIGRDAHGFPGDFC